METKKTKIICTISDINCSVDFIRELYVNGMNVVRINSAHATIEGAQQIVDNVRAVSDRPPVSLQGRQGTSEAGACSGCVRPC